MSSKRTVGLLLACTMILSLFAPIVSEARTWWVYPVNYKIVGRMPDQITGPKSRIFLPEIVAEEEDGIVMDVCYSVIRGEEELAAGQWEKGCFFDLNGEGSYLITYKGVDASNEYSFDILADSMYPSIILESDVPSQGYTDEVFSIPDGKIVYGDKESKPTVDLVMANGNRYSPSSRVIPEHGQVTVTYSATFDKECCSFSYKANILEKYIGFTDESGNFYPAGTKAYDNQELRGSILNGANSLEYTYSEIVDLSKATKDVPLIVLNNASVTGRTTPTVRIVDAHDSQNYIEITGRWTIDSAKVVYSVAKAPNQQEVGYLRNQVYTEKTFGTLTTFPTSAEADKRNPATYYYDAEEKAIYADWYGTKSIVADFDAEYQLYPWSGFTTGEAYIVVIRTRTTDFICVESVCGHSLNETSPDLVAPELTVDLGAYSIAPEAVVGKEYPLFPATASDLEDSTVPVSIRVFKGFDATDGVELNVENNCFVPYDTGNYTVVYTAHDSFGNTTTKKLNVLALNEDELSPISASMPSFPKKAFVGERVMIDAPKDITGGSGNVHYKVTLKTEDGTVTQEKGRYVTIPSEGKNTISYILTDYLSNEKVYSFEINCTVSKDPILYELTMPEYLPNGKVFRIPEAEYAEGTADEITVSASINGNAVEIKDNTLVPDIQNAQAELILTYIAKSSTGKASRSYSIPVYSGNMSDRCSYFQEFHGKMAVVQKDSSIGFETDTTGSAVRFINSILADRLSLSFSVDPARNDTDSFYVIATDALDPDISVRFDMKKMPDGDESSKTEFYINGVKANNMVGNFYGGTNKLTISYNRSSYSLSDSLGNTLGTITKTQNGDQFTGFPSGEVNVAFYAGEVGEKGFAFDLLQINNQSFYDDNMFFDNYAELLVNGTLNLQAEVGSTLIVPSARACDVFSPNASVTVQVNGNGKNVVEPKKADSSFEYELSEYGTYQVIYQYSDGNASRSATYTIRTIEHTPPKIGKVSGLPKSAKVGDRIAITLPEIKDDKAESPVMTVIVREPNNNMILMDVENEPGFTAKYTGTYTVIFYAYDECFNYQVETHEIVVSE